MSLITRTGSMQSQSFIMQQITKNTAEYVQIQEQVTTGQKTQRYMGIADQSAMSINFANQQETLNQYVKSAQTTNSRLSAAHNALSSIIDVATEFRAKLLQAMTANQSSAGQINVVAGEYKKQVESGLNTDLGGVYLFGGTRSDSKPVDLSNPSNNSNGTYYSGSSTLMQSPIDQNTVLSYGATADRQGFKDLIASLQRVTSASGSNTELKTALDDLNSSLADLTQLEAEMGHQMNVVETAQARNEGTISTITAQLSNIRDIDVSAAMVELTQRQTILQASYSVIARSSQMSLVNYLK